MSLRQVWLRQVPLIQGRERYTLMSIDSSNLSSSACKLTRAWPKTAATSVKMHRGTDVAIGNVSNVESLNRLGNPH